LTGRTISKDCLGIFSDWLICRSPGQGEELVARVREALSREERVTRYKVLWEVEAEPLMAASNRQFRQ